MTGGIDAISVETVRINDQVIISDDDGGVYSEDREEGEDLSEEEYNYEIYGNDSVRGADESGA